MATEKFAISYAGSAKEEAITLSRGDQHKIKEVKLTFPGASAGAYVVALRKDSASTADERDVTHADSKGVWIGEGYYDNGTIIIAEDGLSSTGLRLYLSLGSNSGTAYVNIVYDLA